MFNTTNNHYVPRSYLDRFNTNHPLYKYVKDIKKYFPIKDCKSECSRDNIYTLKKQVSQQIVQLLFLAYEPNEIETQYLTYIINFINGTFADFISVSIENKEAQEEINQVQSKVNWVKELIKTQEDIFTHVYENAFYNFLDNITDDINSASYLIKNDKDSYEEINAYFTFKVLSHLSKVYLKRLNNSLEYINHEEDVEKLLDNIKTETKDTLNPVFDLVSYIVMQNLRTLSSLQKLDKQTEDIIADKDDRTNYIFLLIHLLALRITSNILSRDYVIYLIKNNTNNAFITSDSPSCTMAVNNELTYILPINDTLLMVLSNKKNRLNNIKKTVYDCNNHKFVKSINKIIFNHSYKCVYGEKLALEQLNG